MMKSLFNHRRIVFRRLACCLLLLLATTIVMMIHVFNNNNNNNIVQQQKQQRRQLSSSSTLSTTISPPHKKINKYRIATFGASRTMGIGLENPLTQSYASLLGVKTNFAIRASGPEYPAMCAYTMMTTKDQIIYDVVIFEFSNNNAPHHDDPDESSSLKKKKKKKDALFILAARMRQHFPHVTIIFLHLWAPRQIYHVPTGMSLGQWWETTTSSKESSSSQQQQDDNNMMIMAATAGDTSTTTTTSTMYTQMITKMLTDTHWYDWRIIEPDPYATVAQTTADGVGGYVLSMPINRDDPRVSLANYSHFFLEDTIHLSSAGHEWVRNGVLDILERTHAKRSNYTRPWHSQDDCQSWYHDGSMIKSSSSSSIDQQPSPPSPQIQNMNMVEFQPGKFALEITQIGGEGTMLVTNHGRKPVNLFISYMVTSSSPEQQQEQQYYPKAHIWLTSHSNHHQISSSQEITPKWPRPTTTTSSVKKLHVMSHARIGKLEVGNSTLHISIKEETEYPFRLVGILMTPYNFGDTLTALL